MNLSNADPEGSSLREVVDEVDFIWGEAEGRIPVGLRRHAQMYFLGVEESGFRKKIALLRESLAHRRRVRLKFMEHDGRIATVEPCSDEANG
jgi:hypothetical protein